MCVIVEVWLYFLYGVVFFGKIIVGDGVDVEFFVEVVDFGNKLFGLFFIELLNLIGSDFFIEYYVIYIVVEIDVLFIFWCFWFDNFCVFRLSRNVMFDFVWYIFY